MYRPDRNVHKVPRASHDGVIAKVKSAVPFKDIERFILVSMNVHWRSASRRHEGLHCKIRTPRFGASHEKRVQISRSPERSTGSRGTMEQLTAFQHDDASLTYGSARDWRSACRPLSSTVRVLPTCGEGRQS